MPRKGWSAVEVPSAWLQIIRGPRPPAAQWPRAKAQSKPVQKPNPKVGRPPAVQPQQTESHERQRRSPAEVRAMATTKIGRIRAAITSLGPDDTEERASLEAALARAEHLASIPPVDKRIADAEAGKEAHRSRIRQDSRGRKAETPLRAGIGTSGERSDWFPTRGRDARQWFRCSDQSCVCVGGRALASALVPPT